MEGNCIERKMKYVRDCVENVSIIAENQDHFLKFVGLGDNEIELQSVKNAITHVLDCTCIPDDLPSDEKKLEELTGCIESVWGDIELLQNKLPLIVLKWEDEEVEEPGFFARISGRFKKNQKDIRKNRKDALKNAFDSYYSEREMAKHSHDSSVKLIESMDYDKDTKKSKLTDAKETMEARYRRAEFEYDSAVAEIEKKFIIDLKSVMNVSETVQMNEIPVESKVESPVEVVVKAEVVVEPNVEDHSFKALMEEHTERARIIKELNEQVDRLEGVCAAERNRVNAALDQIADRDDRLLAQAELIDSLETKVKDLTKTLEAIRSKKKGK